ncbi:precorrin-6Y C5,15-methyltransferase (decarboxylating) [Singulisphaera sp. GP187]|uniref:bifunctional cobalt-precorrin-7 (C(5))-methyltransferase/cobalt-precorrin-6B (C(15))-methyltransferase n=1 Tax=Singulisphaera sp. GP187 TaxID=1882752 RepID=UPI0009279061|nr:bifunctional cobalt-precorrin-7 (C(5))-methyltransferase/cobalt-precorrin-6B (C(15))-methyltransferase [Singulisphaera sp. GP187]SIO63137.1 precorrin-6Y C5,15-methyltransferase (decarboxylating) [Singulisphaera sp. GP187]
MSRPIHVIGLGANGIESLSPRAKQALSAATFLAGGNRHLALVEPRAIIERFAVTNNLNALVDRLRDRGPDERCVVLASGDPLCYGIGVTLQRALGSDQLEVEPALCSLQLAFARTTQSWHDAAIASIHGRPTASVLIPLLGAPKIGLFTQDGSSPAAVAEFFLERGLDDYQAWVCEDLGSSSERVTPLEIQDLPHRRFRELNFLVLIRRADSESSPGSPPLRSSVPADDRFARPASGPVLLTHQDVRSVVLNRFEDIRPGPIWDLGAGLGGVAIGLANQFPARDVVAVERSPTQLAYLQENRRRFAAWNLRIIHGTAPAALADEPAPAAVFVGGSGSQLDPILDLVLARLVPEGLFVANFVGLENLARTLERLRLEGWSPTVTQLQVSPGQDLAGLTTFVPQRPVWIVRGRRPA